MTSPFADAQVGHRVRRWGAIDDRRMPVPSRAWLRRRGRAWLVLALLLLLAAPVQLLGLDAAVAQTADEDEVTDAGGAVVGRHYRQTGGGTGLGFDVREPFFSRFLELGGPTAVGYPASVPFRGVDGCTYQVFQVMLLQECPGLPVQLANTFQILEESGADDRLEQLGIGKGESDTAASFAEAVRIRLGWLEDSAIAERYLSQCGNEDAEAAVQFCGLPMNRPRAAGPFISQRFQRIAYQLWLSDGPGGIRAGDVSAILGGDLLKETGVVSSLVGRPHALGQVPALATVPFARLTIPPAAAVVPAVPAVPAAVPFRDRATLGIIRAAVETAERAAAAAFRAGRQGQDLLVGDTVRTDTNGNALVTYLEGTTTEVTPSSIVVVQRLEAGPAGAPLVTVRQVAGQTIHRIVQALQPGSVYQIETPATTIVVRGTVVRVTVAADLSTRVEVFRDRAEVTAQGVTVDVRAGTFTNVVPGQPPSAPAPNPAPPPPLAPPAVPTPGPSPTPTPTATPTPPAPTPPPQRTTALSYGFQGDFFATAKRPQAMSWITGAGFGWAKQQLLWNQYEISPSECSGNRANCLEQNINGRQKFFRKDWVGFLDAVVDDLNGSGLSVLLSVVRAPDFYAAPGGHAPANPDMLRDFVQFLASRYRGKVKAIEPWNEQNLAGEWGGGRLWPNAPAAPPQGAVDFVQLQRAAYQGIKAGDGGMIVVLPALTPTGVAECWENVEARTQQFCLDAMRVAIDDRLYLDFLYRVNNGEIRNYYDVLGVHPSGFNNPPDDWIDKKTVPSTGFKGHGSFYIKRYQQLREVQVRYGDTKPMWFTEVGWSVTRNVIGGYEYGRDNSEDARGKYVARLLEQVHREAPYVTNLFIWNLNFRTVVGEGDEKYGFGVINADGSPASGYTCAADFVRSGNRITRAECRS